MDGPFEQGRMKKKTRLHLDGRILAAAKDGYAGADDAEVGLSLENMALN